MKKLEKSGNKGERLPLLGYFKNFPTRVQKIVPFVFQTEPENVQIAISKALHRLNNETNDLQSLTYASPPNCKVNFEFGVAEEDTFTFLDKDELTRLTAALEKRETINILDFFCAIRYHQTVQGGKSKSLRSDYLLLRFAFRRRIMELFLVHERGIQHLPLKDLTAFLIKRINTELVQRKIPSLIPKRVRLIKKV